MGLGLGNLLSGLWQGHQAGVETKRRRRTEDEEREYQAQQRAFQTDQDRKNSAWLDEQRFEQGRIDDYNAKLRGQGQEDYAFNLNKRNEQDALERDTSWLAPALSETDPEKFKTHLRGMNAMQLAIALKYAPLQAQRDIVNEHMDNMKLRESMAPMLGIAQQAGGMVGQGLLPPTGQPFAFGQQPDNGILPRNALQGMSGMLQEQNALPMLGGREDDNLTPAGTGLPATTQPGLLPKTPVTQTPPPMTEGAGILPPRQRASWAGVSASNSEEMKRSNYEATLPMYFDEVESEAEATTYTGGDSKKEKFPLFNPFTGKFLHVKANLDIDNETLGKFHHTSKAFTGGDGAPLPGLPNTSAMSYIGKKPVTGALPPVTTRPPLGIPAGDVAADTGLLPRDGVPADASLDAPIDDTAYPADEYSDYPVLGEPETMNPPKPRQTKAAWIREEEVRFIRNYPGHTRQDIADLRKALNDSYVPREDSTTFTYTLPDGQRLEYTKEQFDELSPSIQKMLLESRIGVQTDQGVKNMSMAEYKAYMAARKDVTYSYLTTDGRTVQLTGEKIIDTLDKAADNARQLDELNMQIEYYSNINDLKTIEAKLLPLKAKLEQDKFMLDRQVRLGQLAVSQTNAQTSRINALDSGGGSGGGSGSGSKSNKTFHHFDSYYTIKPKGSQRDSQLTYQGVELRDINGNLIYGTKDWTPPDYVDYIKAVSAQQRAAGKPTLIDMFASRGVTIK